MSKKSFWNRIGLPCLADIQELKDAAHKQEKALCSLIALNKDTIKLLEETGNHLSKSIEETSDDGQKSVAVAAEKICEAMMKYYDASSQMLIGQSECLSTGLESLDVLHAEIKGVQKATAKQEETSAAIVNLNKDAAHKQEEALCSLIALNKDTIRLLEETGNHLSKSIEETSDDGQKSVAVAAEKICEAMMKYYDASSQMLIGQSECLSTGLESLDVLHAEIKGVQKATAKQEETSAAIVNLNNDLIRLLEAANSKLSASIDKISVDCKETVDLAATKTGDTMQKLCDSEIQILAEQTCKLTENMETIKAFQGEFQRARKEDHEEFEQLLVECKSQEELLRILTANSLLNDVSKLFSKYISSSSYDGQTH